MDENANGDLGDVDMGRLDPLFEDAARLIVYQQQGSTSLIQRKFAIGYNRAGLPVPSPLDRKNTE